MQEEFVKHDKLEWPTIIRESTNRSNIKYLISLKDRQGTLLKKATALVRASWPRADIFDHDRDKISIVEPGLKSRGYKTSCSAQHIRQSQDPNRRRALSSAVG